MFTLRYKTEYAVVPVCTYGEPDAPAAREQCKALYPVQPVHMTKPETLAMMLQSHECDTVFGAACKYLCEGLVQKVSW